MLVDLHLHTTASDGRSTPAELVALAAAAGVGVMAVTDHDTVASCADVAQAARAAGIETITGIEITAVDAGQDVHMLAYFVDTGAAALLDLLRAQRTIRMDRVERIAKRLDELGLPIDSTPLITVPSGGRTIGRPQVADAMIAAGHVANRREAFDRWLGAGKPAFLPRDGASPERVIDIVHTARGIISLAHPGRTGLADDRIAALTAAGLDALEVYHPDHDAALVERYAAMADALGVLRTGGSDFHGDPSYGISVGDVPLPAGHWNRLRSASERYR